MTELIIETYIEAPVEHCFDLARDVSAHAESAAFSGERLVAPGRVTGLLEVGDLVCFEGRHFGITQRFSAKITEMRRPHSLRRRDGSGTLHVAHTCPRIRGAGKRYRDARRSAMAHTARTARSNRGCALSEASHVVVRHDEAAASENDRRASWHDFSVSDLSFRAAQTARNPPRTCEGCARGISRRLRGSR
jgi:hypothetical protein